MSPLPRFAFNRRSNSLRVAHVCSWQILAPSATLNRIISLLSLYIAYYEGTGLPIWPSMPVSASIKNSMILFFFSPRSAAPTIAVFSKPFDKMTSAFFPHQEIPPFPAM